MNRASGRMPPAWSRLSAYTLKSWGLSLLQVVVLAVLVAGAATFSLAISRHASAIHERALRAEIASIAEERLRLVRSSTLRSLEVLHATAAHLETTAEPTRESFRTFVRSALARLPELQALEWIPFVAGHERLAYEQAAQRDGFPEFRFTELDADGNLRPATQRNAYYPVYFIEPENRNLPALGLDLGSHPVRKHTLEAAWRADQPRATEPIRLAQETQSDQLGLLVFLPVRIARETGSRERGFALAALRIHDFVQPALASLDALGMSVRVVDTGAGRALFEQRAGEGREPNGDRSAFAHVAELEVAGRSWALTFTPTEAFLARRASYESQAYSLCGLLITMLAAAYAVRGMRLQGEIAIRKRAQEEAASARKAQSYFLANVSHEIRTPLNAIIGYSQILQRYDSNDALQREALQTIVQSGHHLLTLVDDVIDLSKIESGLVELQQVDFDLSALVSSVSFMFRHKCQTKGIALEVEGLGEPWWVRGDEGKLRQILINLVGNAVKFTEHGEARLRVVPQEGSEVRFEVIDTGIGISEHERGAVFADFYQADASRAEEGAGLGLAISRRLVERMGGVLELRSTPGWGSNFYFTLTFDAPVAVAAPATRADIGQIRLSPETPCSVLVVDDLKVNRDILTHMLQAMGCNVEAASSGEQAVAIAERQKPDVVFLDVLMPGMDGIQTARAIRAGLHGRSAKLVAFSASALEAEREHYQSAGFDAFIAKPFRLERINDCLARLCSVRFVAEGSRKPPPLSMAELASLDVDAVILAQIREAAELYQVTRLRQALDRLERCGAKEHALAEHLRVRAARYDIAAVLEAVHKLEARRAA